MRNLWNFIFKYNFCKKMKQHFVVMYNHKLCNGGMEKHGASFIFYNSFHLYQKI